VKAAIEVSNKKEADAIRAGLNDPAVRAFVVIMGVLSVLPSQRSRERVMQFVADHFSEKLL